MNFDKVNILEGGIKCLSVKTDPNLVNTPVSNTDFAGSFEFEIDHIPELGHNIAFKIIQGFVVKGQPEKVLLIVQSESLFRITPFDVQMFIPPIVPGVLRIMTEISKLALAHNAGMFCILKEDCGMGNFQLGILPDKTIRAKISAQLNPSITN